MKHYEVKSAGIGYSKNVDVLNECLRTQCTRTITLPDVPRRAMAQLIWSMVCPSDIDGIIRFNDGHVDAAKKTLISLLEKV